jgi:SAM-dependent methyltransferase
VDDSTRLELGATFDTSAEGYDARPGYPEPVYTILAERCGFAPGRRVLEIGPGTGQATVRLLELGADVTAVEPGPALAARIHNRAERVAAENGTELQIVVGSFESAELPAAHFDLVVAATSFHWVDPAIGLSKVARHLRPGGWLAIWWTVFGDPNRPDPFSNAIGHGLRELAPELLLDEFVGPRPHALDVEARTAEIDATGSFGPVEHHVVAWEGHHDAIAIRRLFATYSPWLALPEPRRTATLDALERIAREDFADSVTRPYLTSLFLAQRTSKGAPLLQEK